LVARRHLAINQVISLEASDDTKPSFDEIGAERKRYEANEACPLRKANSGLHAPEAAPKYLPS